jgi:hypothetical protein
LYLDDSAGIVYVYTYSAEHYRWFFNQTIYSPGGYSSFFGYSISISNSTIAIGAPGWRPNEYELIGGQNFPNNTGWVYLYDLYAENDTMWLLSQAIQSPVGNNSLFGHSLQLYGDGLVTSAMGFRKSFFFYILFFFYLFFLIFFQIFFCRIISYCIFTFFYF